MEVGTFSQRTLRHTRRSTPRLTWLSSLVSLERSVTCGWREGKHGSGLREEAWSWLTLMSNWRLWLAFSPKLGCDQFLLVFFLFWSSGSAEGFVASVPGMVFFLAVRTTWRCIVVGTPLQSVVCLATVRAVSGFSASLRTVTPFHALGAVLDLGSYCVFRQINHRTPKSRKSADSSVFSTPSPMYLTPRSAGTAQNRLAISEIVQALDILDAYPDWFTKIHKDLVKAGWGGHSF